MACKIDVEAKKLRLSREYERKDMYDTIEAVPSIQSRSVAEKLKSGSSRLWQRLALGGVLLISIFMNFYQLGQNGFTNLYYASAIRSMLDSWHYP
jgi:hypothetical protein